MKKIAILITCFNRVDITLLCLDNLFKSKIPLNFDIEVYLVDDNSPDKTGEIVSREYKQVNIIKGSGELYWNGGMRLAWDTAFKKNDYDFYLWLNDDTLINKDAIINLIDDYYNLVNKNIEAIISGSLCDPKTKQITYVGRYKNKILYPNGVPQRCDMIPGNFVLIPKIVYKKIGNLSSKFTHGFGDTDYGLRVIKGGFSCYISSIYIGVCSANNKILWHNSKLSFKQRKRILFSTTGGNIYEYLQYIKRHRGWGQMYLSTCKTIVRLFLPKIFERKRNYL